MLKAAVDRLGGSVRRARPVEVGQNVGGAFLQCAPQGDDLGQCRGDRVPMARQLRSRLGCRAAVLPPHMSAAGTPVAAHGEHQGRRAPPEGLMSQSAGHGIPYLALLAATSTPSILVGDPTRQHRPVGIQVLAGHLHPELIKPAESGQIGADKARTTGSVVHVEVFRMVGVGTPIIGRPRPLPRQRRADPPYTLICEEPVSCWLGNSSIVARGNDRLSLYCVRSIVRHVCDLAQSVD